MAYEGLDALRARVHEDVALALRLHGIEPELFAAEVMGIAAEFRIVIARAELDEAIARGRQAWIMRWIL